MIIQVVGSRGMLGKAVCKAVQRAGHTLHSGGAVDITNVYIQITGEVVINCAGIVKQRRDIPASEFIHVNAYGPHRLAEYCARLIHVSTDCVFNDHIQNSKVESSTPTPNDIYSLSKLTGEITRQPHLTVRTSFVGFGKRGLLADLFSQKGSTRVEYAGARWSGHTVETVAEALVMLAPLESVSGLIHIPGEFQTRGELIRRLSKRFDLGITVTDSYDEPGYDRRLSSERWDVLGLPALPDFETQLERMQVP